MVLLHGGSPKGAELIAAKWSDARKVTQVAFKPDWTKHAKAAPFKRNDAMLDVLPVGVLVFPGNGIQENLADKAKKLGVPVLKFERGRDRPYSPPGAPGGVWVARGPRAKTPRPAKDNARQQARSTA
jgi:hypothetical protein